MSATPCTACRREVPAGAQFCPSCGVRAAEMATDTPAKPAWYFSRTALIISALLFFPLWAALVIANPRQSKGSKVAAAIIGGAATVLIIYAVGGAPLVATVAGPASMDFGHDYVEVKDNVTIADRVTSFSPGEQLAWVANLRGAAGTRQLSLALSRVTPSGGEEVIERQPFQLASPEFSVVFGKFAVRVAPGRYKLRVFAFDRILAEGTFEVQQSPRASTSGQAGPITPSAWAPLGEWSGSGPKQTELFEVPTSQWRVSWRARGDGLIQIYVYNQTGELVGVAANHQGDGEDVSYVNSSGVHYLVVNAALTSWKVTAEVASR